MITPEEMKTGCIIGYAYMFIYTIIYGIPAVMLCGIIYGLVRLLDLLQ